jgi:hypothetical protein
MHSSSGHSSSQPAPEHLAGSFQLDHDILVGRSRHPESTRKVRRGPQDCFQPRPLLERSLERHRAPCSPDLHRNGPGTVDPRPGVTQQSASHALAKNHSVWVIAAAAARGLPQQVPPVNAGRRFACRSRPNWSPRPPRSKRASAAAPNPPAPRTSGHWKRGAHLHSAEAASPRSA